jgi:hypothetical protein
MNENDRNDATGDFFDLNLRFGHKIGPIKPLGS